MEPEYVQQLTRIEITLNEMKHRLFGNGQPGIIDNYDKRLGELENHKAEVKGGMTMLKLLVVIGPVLASVLFAVVEFAMRRTVIK